MRTIPLRQSGFSLIEALTALLVTAFGMLAIAGFQVSLSHSSDIAKQRTEAVRLAQLKIEELRAYEQAATHTGTPHKFNYTDDVVDGSDVVSPTSGSYSTNTSYARSWFARRGDGTTVASGTDPQKWIRVAVSWTDRTGTLQTVTLQTVIALADPVSIGTLAVGPGGLQTRSPKNRNVEIPYPALGVKVTYEDDQGNVKSVAGSAFLPPGVASLFYVYDNKTGNVLGYCQPVTDVNPADGVPDKLAELVEGVEIDFSDPDWNCTKYLDTLQPYLLSGYIRFVAGNFNLSDFVNPTSPTKALAATVGRTDGGSAPVCYTQQQKVVSAGNVAAPRAILSAARQTVVNGVATEVLVQTNGNHGFGPGDFVSINGVTNTSFNGVFKVKSGSGNTFVYVQNGAPGQSFGSTNPPSTATQVQEITVPEAHSAPTNYSSDYNALKSTFVAYACIVLPVPDAADPPGPNRWSGKFQITASGWTIGSGPGTSKVCRYTGDYVVNGAVSNSENPLYYRAVTGPLDNQNYVVIDGNRSCPTDSAANTATSKYTNVNTSEHQPTEVRSGTNPGGANSNGGFTAQEPSNTVQAIPML